MDIRQLEYFITLYKNKSFTKASTALHISQPSLSNAMHKLEEEVGNTLFDRTQQGIALTEAGKLFLKEAQIILRNFNHLHEVMADYNSKTTHTLRIGFPSTSGAWLWPILLQEFPGKYDNIDVIPYDMGTDDVLRNIRAGKLDLGYSILAFDNADDIETLPLDFGSLKLLLSTEHPLCKSEKVSPSQLLQENIVMYRKDTTYAERSLEQLLRTQHLDMSFQYVNEQATVFNIVSMNLGISVILDEDMPLLQNNPALTTRPFTTPLPYQAGLLWSKEHHLSAGAKAFIEYMTNN